MVMRCQSSHDPALGLDVKDVKEVINFDFPSNVEAGVRRSRPSVRPNDRPTVCSSTCHLFIRFSRLV